jgi:hypothetical protein
MNLRENDTARARFQLDIYATMRLARYINRGSPLYSNSQEALRAILESRFGMDTLAADEYINALLNDNVAVLIKNCLRYRPMVPQRADDDRERAVKALIAA